MKERFVPLDTGRYSKAGEEFYRFLISHMVGQERAIRKLVRAYELYLSPFHNPDKPAVFQIYTGPSGVGKTLLAQLAAEFLLHSRDALIKIDCTRVTNGHEVSAWVGSPPGYISTDKSGELDQEELSRPAAKVLDKALVDDLATHDLCVDVVKRKKVYDDAHRRDRTSPETAMALEAYEQKKTELDEARKRKQPAVFSRSKGQLPSVVLFDEIEKAHPNAYNILMEIADAGQLKMINTGATTSFANTFVFLTSNAGSEEIKKEIKQIGKVGFSSSRAGQEKNQLWKVAIHELGKIFRPEFIGRCRNNIVSFRELRPEEIKIVIGRQLNELQRDFKRVARVYVNISMQVFAFLFDEALQHPEYGARPIRQKIEDSLKTPLAMLVASGQLRKGDWVYAEFHGGKVIFGQRFNEAEEAEDILSSYSTREGTGVGSFSLTGEER